MAVLDVLDGLGELRDAERDELLADHRAAVLLHDVAHPFGRDLAEVVVGGDRVDVLAVLLHHPGDERGELLLRHRAGDDHVGVADAAFILVVVEGEPVELVDDRPVGLARGGGEAGEHHVDLVALQHAAHELLVAVVVGLRVIDHEFDRAPGDAARLVDFLGRELDGVNLADGRGGEVAGLVLENADLDRFGGQCRRSCGCRARQRHGADCIQKFLCHVLNFLLCLDFSVLVVP